MLSTLAFYQLKGRARLRESLKVQEQEAYRLAFHGPASFGGHGTNVVNSEWLRAPSRLLAGGDLFPKPWTVEGTQTSPRGPMDVMSEQVKKPG